jgi:hypothetical protein
LLGGVAALVALAAVPIVRAARAPDPERVELDPARLGAEPLALADYVRAVFADPDKIDGHVVAWPGTIDTLAHFGAGGGDPRSTITAPRPYARTLAMFQVDGPHGPLDGLRVYLELPDSLGWRPPPRARAIVKARIDTNREDPSRDRARLYALGVTPL